MKFLLLEYPKCSTCKSAAAWLNKHQITFETRNITEQCPSKEELRQWHLQSGLPLLQFFNSSGQKYREQNLKDKLKVMTQEEMYTLLSSDGMLVKRPILISDDFILVGYKEEEWSKQLLPKTIKRF